MIDAIRHPLRPRTLILCAFAVVMLLGLYCLLYNAALGRSETVTNAFGWPVANILPFLAAFEFGKRTSGPAPRAALLGLATAISLGLDWLVGGASALGFELVRRIPALLLVSAAWFWLHLATRTSSAASPAALPLLPRQIDWVEAAGNYVLLHGSGQRIIHRATLASVEAALSEQGFIRIHRSRLVRAVAIVRHSRYDVVLIDGERIPIGSRYRSALAG